MAIFRRQARSARDTGMSPFSAGLLASVVLTVLTYFGFTKSNPFANPYELKAVFQTANNLKPRSPVRIAGVDVGKVTKVEPVTEGNGAAEVTMELEDKGLPIHRDAELKIRQRIFLEGNFFIDLRPGSPSAPTLDDGATVPVNQTSAPVQFGQLLTALQSDTREDLKTFLREFSKGLEGKGAQGFNDSIQYWRDAYKNSSLANDATLGEDPTRDLQRVLRGQARTFRALSADEESLKDLVTNFNVTAGAFAREDQALEAAVPALRDTLRVANPALKSLNDSLPSLRAFARDALPGTRSSNPTLKAGVPFIRQARLLVSRRELRGAAAVLRRYIPALVNLNDQSIDISVEGRQLSACTNNVLVPFVQSEVPSPEEPGYDGEQVRYSLQRGLVGLSGESRLSDGNNQYFHAGAVPGTEEVRPAPRLDVDQPPPRRPDVPCETQDPPNLNAPHAENDELSSSADASRARARQRRQNRQADALLRQFEARGKRWEKKKAALEESK